MKDPLVILHRIRRMLRGNHVAEAQRLVETYLEQVEARKV